MTRINLLSCMAFCFYCFMPIAESSSQEANLPESKTAPLEVTSTGIQTVIQSGSSAVAPNLLEFDESGEYLVVAGALTSEVSLWHLPSRTLVRRAFSKRQLISQPLKVSVVQNPLRVTLESPSLFEIWNIAEDNYENTVLEKPEIDLNSKPNWKYFNTKEGNATSIAINPSGNRMAIGKVIDGKLYVESSDLVAGTSRQLRQINAPERLALSNDGNVFASVNSFSAAVFCNEPKSVRTFNVDPGMDFLGATFSQDSKNLILHARIDGSRLTIVNDISSGKLIAAMKHATSLRPQYHASKKQWITADRKRDYRFLAIRDNSNEHNLVKETRTGGPVCAFAIHEKTGIVAAFINDQFNKSSVELYDFDSLNRIGELESQTQLATKPLVDAKTGVIYQVADGVFDWTLETGERNRLHGPIGGDPIAAYEGQILFGSSRGAILYDTKDNSEKRFETSQQALGTAPVAASANLDWFASGNGTSVQLINLTGNRPNFQIARTSTPERPVAEIARVGLSANGDQLGVVDLAGNLEIWDLESKQQTFTVQNNMFISVVYQRASSVKSIHIDSIGFIVEGEFGCLSIRNDDKQHRHSKTPISIPSAVTADGLKLARVNVETDSVELVDRKSFDVIGSFPKEVGEITNLAFTDRPAELVIGLIGGAFEIWNDKSMTASLVPTPDSGFVILTPDGYYKTNNGSVRSVAFRIGGQMRLFDQFDRQRNRPDIILERLGRAQEPLLELHRKSVNWRNETAADPGSKVTGELKVKFPENMPLWTEMSTLNIPMIYESGKDGVLRWEVSANGVPERDATYIDGLEKSSLRVGLLPGDNRILVQAIDSEGRRSEKLSHTVRCLSEQKHGKLFFVGIGVSKYRLAGRNLKLAAKDATDMRNELQTLMHQPIEALVLIDENANKRNVQKRVTEFLLKALRNDTVVLFMAGHGFQDSSEFRFALHDCDFATNSGSLSLSEIEDLVGASQARRRIVLLDACHSGFTVPSGQTDSIKGMASENGETNVKVSPRNSLGFSLPEKPIDRRNAQLRRLLFSQFANDLSKSGTSIIAASDGGQFALESSVWQNGAFTYALREGLRDKTADLDGDSKINLRELAAFVESRVAELTGGDQTPQSRSMNTMLDPELIAAADYQTLDFQFKRTKGQSDFPKLLANDSSGDLLAAVFDKSINVLNTATGDEQIIELHNKSNSILQIEFTGNSKYLIFEERVGTGYHIFAFELASKKRHRLFPKEKYWTYLEPIQLSPNRNSAWVVDVPERGEFSVWNFNDGIEHRTVKFGESSRTPGYVVLPDGKTIRTVANGVVADIDTVTGTRTKLGEIKIRRSDDGYQQDRFRLSANGRVIVSETHQLDADFEIAAWSIDGLKQIAKTDDNSVIAVATPDGTFANSKLFRNHSSSGLPTFSKIFAPFNNSRLRSPVRTFPGESLCLSADESLIALYKDGVWEQEGETTRGIRVYSLVDGREVAWLTPPKLKSYRLGFTADNRSIIAVDSDGTIYSWLLIQDND